MVNFEGPLEQVFVEEVMEPFNLVNARKAVELSGVTSELLKVWIKESAKRLAMKENDMLER